MTEEERGAWEDLRDYLLGNGVPQSVERVIAMDRIHIKLWELCSRDKKILLDIVQANLAGAEEG